MAQTSSKDLDTFAARLVLAMKVLNLSRGQLGAAVGVDKSLVSRWVSGQVVPTNYNLARISDALAKVRPGFNMTLWDSSRADFDSFFGVAPASFAARTTEDTIEPLREAPQSREAVRTGLELRPIQNLSGPDIDGAALGCNSEIGRAMSCLPSLHLVVAPAKNDHPPDYIVDGALQRSGESLRLTVRLQAAFDGHLLWSERYDSPTSKLFKFQEQASGHIASNVDTIVRALEIEKSLNTPENALGVRQLYYRAIGGLRKMERDSYKEAVRSVERAIALAPDHAHALAMASVIYLNVWMSGMGEGDSETWRNRAADRAAQALHVAHNDHWVVGLSAMVLAWVGEPIDVSLAQLDRVLSAAPAFAPIWFWSGLTRSRAGELATAMEHFQKSIELEPLTVQRSLYAGYMAATKVVARDFASALPQLVETLRGRPQFMSMRIFLAVALAYLGRTEEAGKELEIAESIATVANVRWPVRDSATRAMLYEGLRMAGSQDANDVFADV